MTITVEPGQVWADNDRRSKGRTLRVESVDETHATCTVLTNSDSVQRGLDGRSAACGQDTRGKTRRIRLDRFWPTSTGYRLTDPARAVCRDETGGGAMSDREFWVNAGREVMAQSRAIDDAYQRGQRDLAAKVEAVLSDPDNCWWHTGGTPCIPRRAIRNLLADALPQDADSEPASVPLAAEDDSGAAVDVPGAAGLSEAQGGPWVYELAYCEGCGEHYNAFAESHVGHETRDGGAGL